MKVIKFIPFGELAPDARGLDTMQLRRTIGMIPLWGTYRSLPRLKEVSSEPTQYPINGSHAHLVTPERSNQSAQPIADTAVNEWEVFGDEDLAPEGAEPEDHWWRVIQPVNETTGVKLRDGVGAASGEIYQLSPDLEDPNTDENHVIRCRYRFVHVEEVTGFFLNFRLRDTSGGGLIVEIFVDETSYPGGNSWITVEETLTPTEVAAILDYGSLQLDFLGGITYGTINPIAVPVVAVVNESGDWEKVSDDEEQTKASIVDDRDDDTYLKLSGTGSKSFEALLYDVVEPADLENPGTNWTIFTHIGSPDGDIEFDLKLLEAGAEIYSTTKTQAQGAIATVEQVIPETEVAEIEDYTKLSVAIDIRSQAAGAPITLRPDSTKSADAGWLPVPSGTIDDVVGDDNNNTEAQTPDGLVGDLKFRVGIPEPGAHPDDGALVDLKARVTAYSGFNTWKVRFGSGSTQHFQFSTGRISGSNKLIEGNASPTGVDWTDAWIEILADAGNSEPRFCAVVDTWVETSEPTAEFEAQVAEIGLKSPTEIAGLEVCFGEYDLPVSSPITPGDRPKIFAGNELSIYEVSETGGFKDVSKTADSSYGQDIPAITSWQFASWGNRVIATNGSDPIQYQEEEGERFVDLLDVAVEADTEIITCRFVAVARDQVFFANILDDAEPETGEFTVWWTAINNPRLIKRIDLTTLSDFNPIQTMAGAITGLSGGEFVHVYKRASIHRATFTGPPLIWDFQIVSALEGTMFPNSIVNIDRDQFFMGNGGFRHLPFGSGVRPIGDDKINRMFTNKIYEDRALKQFYSQDLREIENSLIGCYDQWSRLIFWLYRGISDNAYENKLGIVYNPWKDMWSQLDLERSPIILGESQQPLPPTYGPEGSGYSHINATQSIPSDDRTLTRGLFAFGKGPDSVTFERSISEKSYPVRYETKVLSSAALGGVEGKIIYIHGIRPIYEIEDAIGEINRTSPVLRAEMHGALDVNFACEHRTQTVATEPDNVDDNGWVMFSQPLVGEYFTLILEWQEIEDEVLREITGFEADVEVGSDN